MNEQHVSPNPSIAIVGAGPRGTSLLERIGAHLSADQAPNPRPLFGATLDVHIIDDAPAGPGRIWRTDQPRDLCMNTLAHAVTLFTEPGATVTGPVREGPTLYEWGVLVRSAASGLGAPPLTPEICAGSSVLDPVKSGTTPAYSAAVREFPVRDGLAADYAEELAALVPESHPSRALYGEYLGWCFDRAIALLPEWVRVTRHRARAVGVERITRVSATSATSAGSASDLAPRAAERELVSLDDGSTITADAVVLATGWLPSAESAAEVELARQLAAEPDANLGSTHGLGHGTGTAGTPATAGATWVRPASPIEQDLSAVAASSNVILRGLGMSFFDTLSLLTLGRGGSFESDSAAPGGLRYVASGAEPVVFATSRRGVPFRSKSLYGGLPPRPAQRFLRAVDWANEPRPINFDRRLWPRIVGDAYLDHAVTLERVRPGSVVAPAAAASAPHGQRGPIGATDASSNASTDLEVAIAETIAELESNTATGTEHADLLHTVTRIATAVASFIQDPELRFDLASELDPAHEKFATPAAFDAWVRERVASDLCEAARGIDSPVKAGLWSVSAARAIASRIGTLGGFDAESRASGFKLLFDLGGMVGSGPPAFRNRQLLALAEAGIVRFIGPEAQVSGVGAGPERGAHFVAESPRVAGSCVDAPALVDAWMHFHSLDATADPLASGLLEAGRARSFRVTPRSAPGEPARPQSATVSTGGFDVDPSSGRLVRADGTLDPAVHVAGIPADQTLHDTVISPMPGTDPPMLRETDRVARSAIRIALSSHPNPVLPLAAAKEGAARA